MAYPSILSSLANPQPTDRLNSPSHSTLHQNENTAITEIETFVGTLSSVQGSLVYDIRASTSNGGGHVQTVNKGGTGQTSYNKGDTLIGQSSSVLAKLAVGTDAQVLTADSGQAVGVRWADAPSGTKIQINTASVIVAGSTSQTPIASASVLGSVMGIANGIRFVIPVTTSTGTSGTFTILSLWYGPNALVSLTLNNPGNNSTPAGVIDGMIIGAGSSSTQAGYLRIVTPGVVASVIGYGTGTSSVVSTTLQQLQIRAQNTNVNASITAVFSEFDKIV